MDGFKKAYVREVDEYVSEVDEFTGMMISNPDYLGKEKKKMEEAGFKIDRENDIYVREGFGAFKTNVNKKIQTIEDLRNYTDEKSGTNPYAEIVRLIDEEGYEFVLGPGSPNGLGCPGLYCKNYKEIIEREKAAKKAVSKEQDER